MSVQRFYHFYILSKHNKNMQRVETNIMGILYYSRFTTLTILKAHFNALQRTVSVSILLSSHWQPF